MSPARSYHGPCTACAPRTLWMLSSKKTGWCRVLGFYGCVSPHKDLAFPDPRADVRHRRTPGRKVPDDGADRWCAAVSSARNRGRESACTARHARTPDCDRDLCGTHRCARDRDHSSGTHSTTHSARSSFLIVEEVRNRVRSLCHRSRAQQAIPKRCPTARY